MRNFILLLGFISFLSSDIKSQYQYIPLAQEGANWLMVYGDEDFTEWDHYIWRIEGDSAINGIQYKVLYRIETPNLNETQSVNQSQVYGFIRENILAKQIFYRGAFNAEDFLLCPQIEEEYLLYDFSKSVGDIIIGCQESEMSEVTTDELVNLYGKERRSLNGILFEGIGHKKGLLTSTLLHAAKGHFLIDYCVGDIDECFGKYYDDNTGNFTENNKQWNILSASNFDGSKRTKKYRISENLEYRQGFYKRILVEDEENGISYLPTDFSLRQSGEKIYYRDVYREYLLYDFGLEIGDTMRIQISSFDNKEYEVVDIDSVEYFDVKRKALYLHCVDDENGEFYGTFTWAEGIGDINLGLFSPLSGCQTDNENFLLCYYENDEIRYNNPLFNACWITPTFEILKDQIKIIPNPSHDIIKIEGLDALDLKIEIYDVSGNIVKSEIFTKNIDISDLSNGMYIIHVFDKNNIYQSRFVKI